MGDTYGRVNEQKEAAGLHERAKLVLELESLMLYFDTKARGRPAFKKMSLAKRVICLILSWRIPYCSQSCYIHVLMQEKVEHEEEDQLTKQVAKMDEQVAKMEEHIAKVDQQLEDQTAVMKQILARLPAAE